MTLSAGTPMGRMPDGAASRVSGSTQCEVALMVVSVGPYRLTRDTSGRAAHRSAASLRVRASPPEKSRVSEVHVSNSWVSRRAWNRVGTAWSAVTWCSRIMPMIACGSRKMPGTPITTRAPTAGARISHWAASKLIGVFCRIETPGPRCPQLASQRNWETTLRCSIITPLGLPVLPEV